jgi:NADH-quinone oxidoreductase subunit B
MMGGLWHSVYLSTVDRINRYASAQSLWVYRAPSGCCADEVLSALGCRYDLERFGIQEALEAEHADVLLIPGALSFKLAGAIQAVYAAMSFPKYVVSIGSCANSGGLFRAPVGYAVVAGSDQVVPVDVYVPGCPPRPEAIMHGILELQAGIERG